MSGGIPKSGKNAAVTTTAAALAASEYCQSIGVQADPDNAVDVFIGDSVAQDIQLTAGSSISLDIRDPSLLFVKSASGTMIINYMLVI